LAPSLFGVSVFLLLPVVLIFVLSLLQWNLLSPPKFVGFQNFLTIFQQDGAGHSLLVTAYYVLLAIPLQTVLSLGMAVMLNRKLPGMGVYRVLFVVPFMATPVALAVVWNWIFDPKFGFANLLLGYLGIPAQNWLGSYRLAMPVLAAVQIWQWVGYNMLFFLAGLQGIPPELLESAAIDGAGHWQRFRRVTLPLLRPTTLFVLVTTIIGSFQVFDTVYVLTDGGPGTSTQVLNLSIYQTAFTDFRIGEASAMSVVLFVVVLIFTFIQFAYFRRRTVYEYV
jgi:multiple sugar transport system permease protein/sn-glycerol 3-phosphate transport system permease protein